MAVEDFQNQTVVSEKSKPDPKGKAIASFVLGIISLVIGVFGALTFFQPKLLWPIFFPYGWDTSAAIALAFLIGGPSFILSAIVGLIGIILGIKGLKSTKKNLAMTGIVLCGVILLFFIGVLIYIFWPFRPSIPPPAPPRY